MGDLSAAFRAECERPAPELYPVLEISAPDGTTKRYSTHGVSSDASGQYEARILGWGEVGESISLADYRLVKSQMDLTLIDTDGAWGQLHASYRNSLRGSAATVKVLSPNVDDGDEFTAFVGKLRSYEMTEPSRWELRLQVDDYELENSDVPRKKIVEADWPNADPTALNEVAPVLWGYHNSASLTGEGMVPALYVDTTGYRYIVSMGWLADVPTVYKDGVTVASGYSITHPVVNGTLWTVVDFTTDQGSSSITCEVEGLTDAYDGSGTLVTNPVAQLEMFLRLFVFSNWASGPYPTTNRIDADSFAAVQVILDDRSPGGSLRLGGESTQRALTVLENWTSGFGVHPYWTFAGQLALGFLDWSPSGTYPSEVIRQPEMQRPLALPFDGSQITREIDYSHLYGAAEAKYYGTVRVQDVTVQERVTLARESPYSLSKVP